MHTKRVIFMLLFISAVICSCKTGEASLRAAVSEGWVDEHCYRVTAIGYPNPNAKDDEWEESAREAAIMLAQTKLYAELYDMLEKKTEENQDALARVTQQTEVVVVEFVESRYAVATVQLKARTLKTAILTGTLSKMGYANGR